MFTEFLQIIMAYSRMPEKNIIQKFRKHIMRKKILSLMVNLRDAEITAESIWDFAQAYSSTSERIPVEGISVVDFPQGIERGVIFTYKDNRFAIYVNVINNDNKHLSASINVKEYKQKHFEFPNGVFEAYTNNENDAEIIDLSKYWIRAMFETYMYALISEQWEVTRWI